MITGNYTSGCENVIKDGLRGIDSPNLWAKYSDGKKESKLLGKIPGWKERVQTFGQNARMEWNGMKYKNRYKIYGGNIS